ncbi:MAG: fumarylacetoacetate hydrolase family protein [Pseudonocardia sp.]|nr:fumarylacetoacetate hydrolase family protein [Pseudonocardia sp.]
MRLATFETGSRRRVGVLGADGALRDVTDRLPAGTGVAELIEGWVSFGPALSAVLPDSPMVPLDRVTLCAPIPEPRRNLFCVGKNYAEHAREFNDSGFDSSASEDRPARPVIFTKATTSVTGPYSPVELHPSITAQVDYEVELVAIIGRGGRGIPRSEAYRHVWGYTVINDVTARDLQRDHRQWFLGKSLDTHCPMGPYAVSADEVVVDELEVASRVNGEPRQKASVRDLIFDIPTLVETLSVGMTLQPGDLIATGTPAGVGIGFDPPKFLANGDVVEVSVSGIGSLRNEFREGL